MGSSDLGCLARCWGICSYCGGRRFGGWFYRGLNGMESVTMASRGDAGGMEKDNRHGRLHVNVTW